MFSWNCTWRQFWASSLPVLSKLSRSRFGEFPWSWFHSLHATSHALHPMQTEVSVKNPTRFATAISCTPPRESHVHQIGRDLLEAALAGVEVERDRRQLVHDGHRARVAIENNRQQVRPADFAGVDPEMRKALLVGEHQQGARGGLAAAGARHPRVTP